MVVSDMLQDCSQDLLCLSLLYPAAPWVKILEKSYCPQSTSGFSEKHYTGGYKAVAAKYSKILMFPFCCYMQVILRLMMKKVSG